MNLILIEPHEVDAGGNVAMTGRRAAHLRSVLRVTPGSEVRVGVVDGPAGHATVVQVDESGVRLRCTFEGGAPAPPRVDLLLALPRPKVLRRLWPQLAALGVGRILLTNAALVERNYFDTHLLDPEIYRPLLIEGLEQARDTRLPDVTVHRQLKVLLEDHLPQDPLTQRLFADPAHGAAVATTLRGSATVRVLLAIGPEGGWTSYERAMLARHAFAPVTLGPRTLRSDTACVALLALVHAALQASPGGAGAAPSLPG